MASSQNPNDRLLKELHFYLAGQMRPARLRSSQALLDWFDRVYR